MQYFDGAKNLGRVFRLATADLQGGSAGWATKTLRESVRRALLLAIAGWQGIMLYAVLVSSTSAGINWLLMAAHLALSILALLARERRAAGWLVVLLCYSLSLWDWSGTALNSALTLAACWLVNLASLALAFIVPGRRAILLATISILPLPLALHVIRPEWEGVLAGAIPPTQVAILVATRLGLAALLEFSRHVDEDRAASEREFENSEVAKAKRHKVAEDTRQLHDTVINTFGAVANGGRGADYPEIVRQRSAHDLAVLNGLRESDNPRGAADLNLLSVFQAPGFELVRTGLDDTHLMQVEDRILPERVRLLAAATIELVQNAIKHSGSDRVAVDMRLQSEALIITVSDSGVGFDVQAGYGTGLTRSVIDRVHEASASVRIDSAVGNGTTAVIRAMITESDGLADNADHSADISTTAAGLLIRTAWLWAIGVTAVGFVIEIAGSRAQFTAGYLMLMVNVVAGFIFWCLRNRTPFVGLMILILTAPLVFALSAGAVDFGREDVFRWQSLAPTAALILFFAAWPPRIMRWAAVATYAATTLIITLLVWSADSVAGFTIPVGGAVSLVLLATWASLQRTVWIIGARALSDQHEALELKIEVAISDAVADAHQRWLGPGLRDAKVLLESLAQGESDPRDARVRRECADQESYLRQMILLSSDMYHLGSWLMRALTESRARGVHLTVRAAEADVFDDDTAVKVGRLLIDAVTGATKGDSITMTVFPSGDGLRIILVAARGRLAAVSTNTSGWTKPYLSAESAVYSSVGEKDLLELHLGRRAPHEELVMV